MVNVGSAGVIDDDAAQRVDRGVEPRDHPVDLDQQGIPGNTSSGPGSAELGRLTRTRPSSVISPE